MIVMAVSGCTGKKPAEQYVSEQLNCSLPAAEKAEVSDTHGGFHGEGEYAAAIRFDTVHGAQLTEQLQNTDGWKATATIDTFTATANTITFISRSRVCYLRVCVLAIRTSHLLLLLFY